MALSKGDTLATVFGRYILNINFFQESVFDSIWIGGLFDDFNFLFGNIIDQSLDRIPDDAKPTGYVNDKYSPRSFGIMSCCKGGCSFDKVDDFSCKIPHAHSLQVDDVNAFSIFRGFNDGPHELATESVMSKQVIHGYAGISHGFQINLGGRFIVAGLIVLAPEMKVMWIVLFDDLKVGMWLLQDGIHAHVLSPLQRRLPSTLG